jgi:hypothetical protein
MGSPQDPKIHPSRLPRRSPELAAAARGQFQAKLMSMALYVNQARRIWYRPPHARWSQELYRAAPS